MTDDVLARLLTFPNVIVTAHQAFLTREALDEIARVTTENITAFSRGESPDESRIVTA
jgi:D-lactate dehydrogenase